jgi:hypothetical protein
MQSEFNFYGCRTAIGFKPSAILHYARIFLPSCEVICMGTSGKSMNLKIISYAKEKIVG